MQTHMDREHAWHKLESEAERSMKESLAEITAGGPRETPLREWTAYDVAVREYGVREVDEPLGLVRVSVGGQETNERVAYCVFRGDIAEVKAILRRALNALRDAP